MKIATVIKPFKAKKKITIQITLSCKLPRYLRLKTSRACSLFFFKHGVKKTFDRFANIFIQCSTAVFYSYLS